MKQSRLLGAICACICVFTAPKVMSVTIDTYFGWNYVDSLVILGQPPAPFPFPEMALTSITYQGASGIITQAMPDFGVPGSGMPDGEGINNNPTYLTTFPDGDGETTRTITSPLPIDWFEAGATTPWGTSSFPTIGITGISVFNVPGILTSASQYVIGLIPFGTNTELSSTLGGVQSDIYDASRIVSFSADPLTGINGSGNFIFSAAASTVPIPAAFWLFGSGLIGLIGIARGKKA